MARVTVEDCVEKIPNRFELVMTASTRVRKISAGAALTIEKDNDKNPVVALREIAGETVDIAALKEDLIKGYQRTVVYEEDDTIDLMDGEKEWGDMAERSDADGLYADENIDEDEDEAEAPAEVAAEESE